MSYASRITEKKFPWGGKALVTKFAAHGRVSITGSIAGGGRLAGSRALAEAHASMLLEGTGKKTKTEIQMLLDDLGASLSFSVEKDRLVFNGHVRASYAKKLLMLVSEVLREPSFPAKEFATVVDRMRAELSIEGQETRTQAGINLSQLLYAPGHPNYQIATSDSRAALEKLTRKDLQKYHARAIDRSSLVISIAGDLPKTESFTLADSIFSKLPKGPALLPLCDPALPSKTKLKHVHLEDKSSIDFMLGIATGITKDNADYPALLLGLQILGNRSGFTGRLMRTVREIEGLTYGVYAFTGGFLNADGFAAVWATFAPTLFEKGKAAVMREIRKIVDEGPTDDEVEKHRTMFEARSRVMLSNSSDLARAAHDVAIEGRKPAYLDEFPKTMLRVTRSQVTAALKKYLITTDLSESAAGPIADQG